MDKNRDKQISLGEYVKYLEKKKATDLTHQSIFSALDKDGNGSLDFEEVIVLHYIMQSGRAIICMSCKTLMAGAYFSCSQCFFKDASVSTFDICCDCYGGKKFTHHGGATFCDNYTLLRQSRSAIQEAPMKKRSKVIIILKKGLQIASITIGLGGLISIASGGDGKISDLFDDDDDDDGAGADADGDGDADADADGDGDDGDTS